MRRGSFGKVFFTFLALGVGIGIVGSAQISRAVKTGGLDTEGSGIGRMLTGLFEPDQTGETGAAGDPNQPALQPTAPVARSAVFTQVLQSVDPPAPIPATCSQPDPTAKAAVIGDRLRLRFFEKTILGGATANAEADVAEIAYERLDLSSSYEVGADGEISLPLAGRIRVAGMTLPCVELAASHRMYDANKTLPQVSASFEWRPAITVRGAVRAPGSYTHEPGMSIQRLLALAGSPSDGGIQDAQHYLSLLTQKAELDRARLGLLLKTARAEALSRGSRTLDLADEPRAEVLAVLGPDRLRKEEEALVAEADAIDTATAGLAARLQDLDLLDSETTKMLAKVDTQYQELSERRDELLSLKERGFASTERLDGNNFNIIAAEREMLSLQKSLLQNRSDMNQAKQKAELDASERRKGLAVELRDLAEEAEVLKSREMTLDAELSMFESGLTRSGKGLRISIEIARPGPEGVDEFAATPETPVLPGDLVVVSAALPSDMLRKATATAAEKAGEVAPLGQALQ